MTLDELVKLYNDAAAHEYEVFLGRGNWGSSTLDVGLDMKRAGIRAVVTALRDEACRDCRHVIDEILASDGVDKAAGGSTREGERALKGAASTPAAAYCPSCLNPIKSEAAR